MRKPIAYGIDFGTSNSAISVGYADQAELVPLGPDGDDVMPSMIYLDSTRQKLAGHAAVRQFLVAGSQNGVRLMSTVKSFLADDTWRGTEAPWLEIITPPEVVAVLLRELKRQADAFCGHDVKRAVLGHPVLFVGAEGEGFARLNNLAKERLKRAAELAGFKEVLLVEESTAALAGEEYRPGVMVALDFGGGTFDVSVMSTDSQNQRELMASRGATVGGERFNELLFDGFVAESLGLTGEHRNQWGNLLPVPSSIRKFRSLDGALRMVSDSATHKALDDMIHAGGGRALKDLDEILFGGHTYAFHKAVEAAKIELSDTDTAAIDFVRRNISLHALATRKTFERLIGPDLDRVDLVVDEALDAAGITADDVDLVVRTGGSSQLPLFASRMSKKFGAHKVEARDALATVALGLGLKGIEAWS